MILFGCMKIVMFTFLMFEGFTQLQDIQQCNSGNVDLFFEPKVPHFENELCCQTFLLEGACLCAQWNISRHKPT